MSQQQLGVRLGPRVSMVSCACVAPLSHEVWAIRLVVGAHKVLASKRHSEY